jgi:hypothetical protein
MKQDKYTYISIFCFFSILVITKIIIIKAYGNATPFWDQWDAEAMKLFLPWQRNTLNWTDLFSAHNEHRIFTLRVFVLALFELNNKVWDPLLEMQANAVIHALSLSVLLIYFCKTLKQNNKIVLIMFSILLFSIPFGWENTLAGFQSQFYFLLLFSFIFLWGMASCETYSLGWWMGLLTGILCPLSLASGAITLIAGSVINLIRNIQQKKSYNITITSSLIILTVAVISIYLTPHPDYHKSLQAHSIYDWVEGILKIASWPTKGLFLCLIIQAPLMVFTYLCFRKKIDISLPQYLFIFGLTIWIAGQFLSISYGRNATVLSSRYLDLFSVGLILNFVALIILFERSNEHDRPYLKVIAIVWFLSVSLGLYQEVFMATYADLNLKKTQGLEQEKNVRSYLCSRNISDLQNKISQQIPYPDPNRLAMILDIPEIQKILPGNIYLPNASYTDNALYKEACDQAKLHNAYSIKTTNVLVPYTNDFVSLNNIISNEWHGSDYDKSHLPGMTTFGSYINSDSNIGVITLSMERGQKILFRSGPNVHNQFILIDTDEGSNSFKIDAPLALDWIVLEFSHPDLPDHFKVNFVDAGKGFGQWSAIGLRNTQNE